MKDVRVGLLGYGTVGRATTDIIRKHANLIESRTGIRLEFTAICGQSAVKPEDVAAAARLISHLHEFRIGSQKFGKPDPREPAGPFSFDANVAGDQYGPTL